MAKKPGKKPLDPRRFMVRNPWSNVWVRQCSAAFGALLVLAGLCAGFYAARAYAVTVISHNGAAPLRRVVLVNPPSWLSPALLNAIAEETVHFAVENPRHPDRAAALQDPLNDRILRQIANHYINNPARAQNAWIKSILYVRRGLVGDQQQIQIAAIYRRPAAMVRAGGMYYLVTARGVRLPGDYTPAVAASMTRLMTITGIAEKPPAPGGVYGRGDLATGLAVAALLQGAAYRRQISAIDMSNYDGRRDHLAPQIVLDTVYRTQVWWGRAPGREGFYEIPAAAKLKALSEIYFHYGRIDAGKAYVDIRTEEVKVPRQLPGQTVVAGG